MKTRNFKIFIPLLVALTSCVDVIENDEEISQRFADLGIAIGGKFVNKNKYVAEIFLGFSRALEKQYEAKRRI